MGHNVFHDFEKEGLSNKVSVLSQQYEVVGHLY